MATEPRLATELWVQAYFVRLRLLDIPAFVTARGDAIAGAVLVKLNTLDGRARLSQRRYDLMRDERLWSVTAEGPEPEIDSAIDRERRADPDLWVIEVEDSAGRDLLDDPTLV